MSKNKVIETEERPPIVLVNRCFIRNRFESNKFLIVRRSEQSSYNPGKWELPGGKLEAGESLGDARNIEVFEETGLLVAAEFPLTYATSSVLMDGKYTGHTYLVIFHFMRQLSGEVRLSKEHTAHQWVQWKNLTRKGVTLETERAIVAFSDFVDT